jgi:NAD(P)H-dependent flavin oxidoreductase YrpB (nitropropane dioxygenase family)
MKTRITELFGIKHPIILSPMAFVARAPLVIAVCKAGGLGLFGPPGLTVEEMRQQIREIKANVGGRPFGVNIMPVMPKVRELIQLLIDEEVPVWTSGLRNPLTVFNIKKPKNVIFIPAVGNVRQALSVEKSGADAVIVQSLESGGHAGLIASTVLVPEVSRAVKIPVVSAGGYCDGNGLAAALALGAEGIAMGTRFAVTQESPIPEGLKKAFIDARDSDAVLSAVWDGMPQRAITKMKHYRGWWSHPWDAIPNLIASKKVFNASWKEILENARMLMQMKVSPPQFATGMALFRKSLANGNIKKSFSPAGQVVGLINDIPNCQELIERTVAGAEQVIKDLYTGKTGGK